MNITILVVIIIVIKGNQKQLCMVVTTVRINYIV